MTITRACSLALILALGACSTAQPRLAEPAPAPTARSEWAMWQLQASKEASAGSFSVADKLLGDFGARYPASPEAAEAMYWRALYKLDPGNPVSAPHDASVLLDGYLASGITAHRAEAQTLRRVANSLETQARAATPAVKTDVVKVDDRARDEELAHLREELARANAELERIKRRLAQPKP